MTRARQRIEQCSTAEEALDSLCHWFYEHRMSAEGCEPIEPDALPAVSHDLLVHHDHMTARLEQYHGQPVALQVLDHRQDGNLYSRHILLTLAGTERVVEYGIVRIDLEFAPPVVRDAIVEREQPLGDILMSNDVLRRIDPRWYFHFAKDSPVAAHFAEHLEAGVFGRLGTIYVDEQPAIELLEVVTEQKHVG